MTWYYIDETITDGDRRKGPFDLEEIKDLVNQNQITNSTLVWHSGLDKFIPWEETDESKITPNPEETEDELLKRTIEELLAQQVKEQGTKKLYAGFFTRALAFIIDNSILTILAILLLQLLGALQLVDLNSLAQTLQSLSDTASENYSQFVESIMKEPAMETLFIIATVSQALYFIIFTAIWGATPGKMLLHLKVETAEGKKIGWIASTTRYIASIFTQLTLALYGIGYLIVMIDPKRRALHDYIARSRVVFEPKIKISIKSQQEK